MFSRNEIYDFAIRIENNGEKFYRDAQKQVSDESLKSLFNRLADDEVKHVDFFIKKKEALKLTPEDPELEKIASNILQEILGDQSFSLKEANMTDLKTMDDLMSLAIEFEEDTVLFYEMLTALATEGGTLQGLQEIIEEEKRHVAALTESRRGGGLRNAF